MKHKMVKWRNDGHIAWDRAATHNINIRVCRDMLLVTFYNAPFDSSTADFYRHLPSALERINVDPRIPWLFDFKLAFRFK